MKYDERGSMLMIALWTLAILSLLALGTGTSAWTELKLNALQTNQVRDQRLIQGGIEVARQVLSLSSAQSVTSFRDPWASPTASLQTVSLPDGCLSFQRLSDSPEGAWGLDDEQGRLNLNTVSAGTLQQLLGDDQDSLVNAIIAWRGAGIQPEGLDEQNDYYQALAPAYECKRAPFESVEELLLVHGMTSAIYERIRPWVTVYTSGLININTAPGPVLSALGFEPSLVDKIMQYRQGPDSKYGTDDDGVFESVAAIIPDLSRDASLLVDETAQISAVQAQLTVRSTCFRAHMALSPDCDPQDRGYRVEVVLAASGLQGQWIIKHFSSL